MTAKLTHAYKVAGTKKEVLGLLTELQAAPQHRWIPVEEMSTSNQATVTARQAGWLSAIVSRKLPKAGLEFSVVAPAQEAK